MLVNSELQDFAYLPTKAVLQDPCSYEPILSVFLELEESHQEVCRERDASRLRDVLHANILIVHAFSVCLDRADDRGLELVADRAQLLRHV